MPPASPSSARPAVPFVCDPGRLRLAVAARQRALGLSQHQISGQTGVSEPRLSRFLGPEAEAPSAATVLQLVYWLEMPLESFNRDQRRDREHEQAAPAA